MKKIKLLNLVIVAAFLATAIYGLWAPICTSAEEATRTLGNSMINEMEPINRLYGGPQDPRIVAANLIKIFMSIFTIIFLCFIIYAGFVWMTAGGNEDRVRTAKQILITGTIGVGIIMSAYAIAKTVVIVFGCAAGDAPQWCLFFHRL